jgi:DNA-binding NarL/FixJ family response regulator
MPINIVIADDHLIFREGLIAMMSREKQLNVVGHASNGKQLVDIVSRQTPDVVITDVHMPEMDGIQATRIITESFPFVSVVALSTSNEDQSVANMVNAGARGYLLKNVNCSELVSAIETVHEKGSYYCTATIGTLTRLMSQSNDAAGKKPDFTERETEIIKLICRQYSSKEIADRLDLSCRAIESTRERILEKTGARNMIGIALFAIKWKIVLLNEVYTLL